MTFSFNPNYQLFVAEEPRSRERQSTQDCELVMSGPERNWYRPPPDALLRSTVSHYRNLTIQADDIVNLF